ncbi:MAG: DNA repair protein RecN [Bacteroidota bacterium]|nr:DNA repair protein RecN [Bacteroidota bacterium]
MLSNLIIKNYALIKLLEISPSPELNIITGETGAGKSIMLGAIGLLLGKRADTKSLYNEGDKCIIEGSFNISSYQLQKLFKEEDLDYEPITIIRREISQTGKSRAFINDTPVTLEALKTIGSNLMDIHSQHDTLLLGSNSYQLSIIDNYARNHILFEDYKTSYHQYVQLHKQYESLLQGAEDLKNEADYHQFLWEEISSANLQEGEQEEMEEELKKLENAEEIKLKLNEVVLYLNNSEYAVQSSLYTAINALHQVSDYSQQYASLKDRLESCLIEIKDVNQEVENEEQFVEYDPQKIQFINDRLNLIYKLQQKHRMPSVEELLKFQGELEEKIHKIQNVDIELDELKRKMEDARQIMLQQGANLSLSRKDVFEKIKNELVVLLRELGMPDASIDIRCKNIDPTPSGLDSVDILFSANKGIKPQELKNVASGGEFSRLMFCVKYILADKTALPTIIFDEIDTGISGAIAMKMVNMMKKMAQAHQVIAISHLPQIAAKGDAHYFVYKDNSSDKTNSKIKQLSESERVEAIAMMIGGDNPSPVAFQNARELMTFNL